MLPPSSKALLWQGSSGVSGLRRFPPAPSFRLNSSPALQFLGRRVATPDNLAAIRDFMELAPFPNLVFGTDRLRPELSGMGDRASMASARMARFSSSEPSKLMAWS
jgi:hypothetical protein